DAAVHPVRDAACLPEGGHEIVLADVDEPERRGRPRDRDRRRGAAARVVREQGLEVDVEELVAVQREDVARLAPLLRGEADPAASPEPLRLLRYGDLRAQAVELRSEEVALAGGAADDHALDARRREAQHLVGDERLPADG